MTKRILLVLMVISFVVLQNSWGIRLRPFLKVKGTSDDNIYLDPSGAKSTVITTISPGLNIVLPMKAHLFTLSGFLDMISYGENPDQNDAQHQTTKIAIDSAIGGGSKFRLGSISQSTSDPAYTELTDRVERTQNTTTLSLNSRLAAGIGVDVNYKATNHDYKESTYDSYDRLENSFGVCFSYLLSKIALLAGINTGSISYETVLNDNTFNQIEIGIEKKVTARLKTMIKVGQETRDYKWQTDPESFPILTLQVTERLSPNTLIKVSGEKRAYESAVYSENPYFDSIAFIVGLDQTLNQKALLAIGVTYRMNDYPNAVPVGSITDYRQDTLMDMKIGVDYEIQRWLSVRVSMRNRSRVSTLAAWDYGNTLIEAGVDLSY
jgi:hypothetical protein